MRPEVIFTQQMPCPDLLPVELSSSSSAVFFKKVGCHDPPLLPILNQSHEFFKSHSHPIFEVYHPLHSRSFSGCFPFPLAFFQSQPADVITSDQVTKVGSFLLFIIGHHHRKNTGHQMALATSAVRQNETGANCRTCFESTNKCNNKTNQNIKFTKSHPTIACCYSSKYFISILFTFHTL